jgi:hypothetical protein
MQNEEIDFNSIENQFQQVKGDLAPYWRVVDDRNSSCRFYISFLQGIDGKRGTGSLLYYLLELQENEIV